MTKQIFRLLLFLLIGVFAVFSVPAENLPSGFMNIKLGMDLNSVKKELSENSYFNYRGDPDVSMLSSPDQMLIECSGYAYIDKAYFQFNNEKLFIITLVINTGSLDFYSMHTSFEAKYGKPYKVDPDGAYWEDDNFKFHLEKPLSVKYMDKKALAEIASGIKQLESRSAKNREDFLNNF